MFCCKKSSLINFATSTRTLSDSNRQSFATEVSSQRKVRLLALILPFPQPAPPLSGHLHAEEFPCIWFEEKQIQDLLSHRKDQESSDTLNNSAAS